MTCIDNATYLQAVSDCAALKSVKGLGSPNYVFRGQVRGVGDLVTSSSSYDPCALAAQMPCPQGGADLVCGTGTFKSCLLVAPGKPAQCNCLPIKPAAATPMTAVMTPAVAPAATTAGFSQWGLLAAVAAVGVGYAVYAHSKKKKAS